MGYHVMATTTEGKEVSMADISHSADFIYVSKTYPVRTNPISIKSTWFRGDVKRDGRVVTLRHIVYDVSVTWDVSDSVETVTHCLETWWVAVKVRDC